MGQKRTTPGIIRAALVHQWVSPVHISSHPAHPLISKILMLTNSRPPGRCLSPTPANVYPLMGIGSCKSLLEHRATARQGPTRIIMLVNDGGTATQPRAPGHERPFTASAGAAKHGRLSAATRAPGADIPPATMAGAPGQYCLRAAHQAPGHERPHAALRAARHGRPRAAPRAPGADVPPAIPAEAPGQYRLRAAPSVPVSDRSRPVQKAPGHGRPRAASSDAVRHDRPCATLKAPGADVPLDHHGRGAGSAPSACHGERHRRLAGRPTPAVPGRLAPHSCQSPHPNSLTCPPRLHPHPHYRLPRYPVPLHRGGATGGPAPSPLSKCWRGAGGEALRPHHPPSASCHPSTTPAAALLHRGRGLSATPPLPRPAGRRIPTRANSPPSPNVGEGAGYPAKGAPHLALSVRLWPVSRVRPAPQPRDWKAGRAP